MSIVPVLALLVAAAFPLSAQQRAIAPHGDSDHVEDCEDCHTAANWRVLRGDIEFDHYSTGFALVGKHEDVDCVSCHADLRFDRLELRLLLVPRERGELR